jgi:hypothetical protein
VLLSCVRKWFFGSIPYLLAAGTLLLGIFELAKDKEDYSKRRLGTPVAVIFIIVALLQFVSLYQDRREKADAEKNIGDLAGQVEAANQAQSDNTKMYVDSFSKMSSKLGELQTEVKTDVLQKKIGTLQSELQSTEKALAPGPKAKLLFTFVPFPNPPEGATPVTSVTLPKNIDGTMHFDFSVLNLTEVDATDIDINLFICDRCKYEKESPLLLKVTGMSEKMRLLNIPLLHAKEGYQAVGVDFIPPADTTPTGATIQVGFTYRCHTCDLDTTASRGTIHIQ